MISHRLFCLRLRAAGFALASVAGGISVAHSASCGYIVQSIQARECGRHKCSGYVARVRGLGSFLTEPTACAVGYQYVAGYAGSPAGHRLGKKGGDLSRELITQDTRKARVPDRDVASATASASR